MSQLDYCYHCLNQLKQECDNFEFTMNIVYHIYCINTCSLFGPSYRAGKVPPGVLREDGGQERGGVRTGCAEGIGAHAARGIDRANTNEKEEGDRCGEAECA
eukprot:13933530-Heterocapsa_arctica.AAC.1